MSFDYSKLRGRIIEKYGSCGEFAKAVGWSINTLSRKLNHHTRFSTDDIENLTRMLKIPESEIPAYFFCKTSLQNVN